MDIQQEEAKDGKRLLSHLWTWHINWEEQVPYFSESYTNLKWAGDAEALASVDICFWGQEF